MIMGNARLGTLQEMKYCYYYYRIGSRSTQIHLVLMINLDSMDLFNYGNGSRQASVFLFRDSMFRFHLLHTATQPYIFLDS